MSAISDFATSVWKEIRDRLVGVVSDACLFLVWLFILLVSFLALHAMARFGYPAERLDFIESIHYYAYLSIFVLFMFDLFAKTVVSIWKGFK